MDITLLDTKNGMAICYLKSKQRAMLISTPQPDVSNYTELEKRSPC